MTEAAVADSRLAKVCATIAADGYFTLPDFLQPPAVAALASEARRRDRAGEFHPARIGHGERSAERADIRGDRISWLDERSPAPAERALWRALESLRAALNEACFLGLFAFEGHYALYPPGAFYRRHRDRFRDDDARVLSCVLYLNQGWSAADGGALRLYVSESAPIEILPLGGTLVCFLAADYEHEVLPARRERLALTGWFKRRS
jgi:SM-20-related protein